MNMSLPKDYAERVYAGVLGKIIGVYLGRPFEGWSYNKIMDELGEINYYVHEKLNLPLIVTDDDITGTFTFIRALEDYGYNKNVTAEQIGETWLNYLIENRTILWWGGMGQSTEHTAYLRLKNGIPAPTSGSIEMNGKVVAEQIGAQIFIDAWAMVAPGDPDLACELARKAGSVSHDGEALYGAIVLAVMESLAFIESDINKLLDKAITYIPEDSIIYQMIHDIRQWHASIPDWRDARDLLEENYGYHIYGGNCHMVPNHGLIILSLLYGDDDFQKTLMIVNTCGWDTDCNSANVGCLMGIKNGLAGLETGPDWRGPVADRMYLPTADGSRSVSDALTESYHIINIGRKLAGFSQITPKEGARFHFDMPGAVQGFQVENSIECRGTAIVENIQGNSKLGDRSLAIHYQNVALGRSCRVGTDTFISKEAQSMPGYALIATPALYAGQEVKARITADDKNAQAINLRLYVKVYDENNDPQVTYSYAEKLEAGGEADMIWTIPETNGYPIAEIGIEAASNQRANGSVYLDYLTWHGQPELVLAPTQGGIMWQKAWVNGVDQFGAANGLIQLIHNEGTGLVMQGTRDWKDYRVTAVITPHLAKSSGIGVRAQGMRRYYSLLLCNDQTLRLVRSFGKQTVLAEQKFEWKFDNEYKLSLQALDNTLMAWLDDKLVFEIKDEKHLTGGAAALICEEGKIFADKVIIEKPY